MLGLNQKMSHPTIIIETFSSFSQPQLYIVQAESNCAIAVLQTVHECMMDYAVDRSKKHKQSRVAANVNRENRRKSEKIVFETAENVVGFFCASALRASMVVSV